MMEVDKKVEQLWAETVKILFHNEDELNSYMGNLYHYTSLSGLLGILQSQKIWGTEFSYLNDSSEMSYGLKLIDVHLLEFSKGKDLWVDKFINITMESLKETCNMEIYIACFCENGDLLSQWKGYTEFGKGFSIGLDASQLSKFKRKGPYVNIDIRKVIYDEALQSIIIKDLIEKFYHEAKKIIDKESGQTEKIIKNYAVALSSLLEMNVLRFKHASFKEEREWRAIYDAHKPNLEPEKQKQYFRVTSTDIVPYVELDIAPSAQKNTWFLPISEIILGSKINFDKANKSINLIYRDLDTEIPKILKSKIPLQ